MIMRLLLPTALALAGIVALGATAHSVQPADPLCSCVSYIQWGSCDATGIGLGSATQTLTCTVVSNATCNVGGTMTWVPANPQTCNTFSTTSYWGIPQTTFDPSLSVGIQVFSPSGAANCTGSSPYPTTGGYINVVDNQFGCSLLCQRYWQCQYN